MAITLTIGGVDRSEYVGAGSARARRSLNQRSTMDLLLDPRTSGYAPTIGQPVYLLNGATKIFGGFLYSQSKYVEPGTSALKMNCRCLDWNHICDRRTVTEDYVASSPPVDWSLVIADIVGKFLVGEGITTTGVSAGSGWAVDMPFKNRPVSECFDRISTITGWQWFVDPDKVLWFGPFAQSPVSAAPFGLTADSANWFDMEVEQSLDRYRNVQIVQTENPISVAIADSWEMNGTSFWYPTTAAVSEIPVVKVNAVAKTVGTIFPNTQPYPGTHDFYVYDWTLAGGPTYGVYVESPASYSSSDTLSIEYGSQTVHSVTRTDLAAIAARAAIEGGSGRHEAVEDQRDLDSTAALNAYGDGLLRQYGSLPTKVSFKTRTAGLEPGQTISIVYAPLSLNDSYLIEEVSYQWVPARTDFLLCNVKCSDQEIFGRPQKLFERMVSMSRISKAANEAASGSATTFVDRFKVTFLFYDDAVAVDDTTDIPYRIDDLDADEYVEWESWSLEAGTTPTGANLELTIETSTLYNSPLSWSEVAVLTLSPSSPPETAGATGTTFTATQAVLNDYLRARVTGIGSGTAGGYIRAVVEGKIYRST